MSEGDRRQPHEQLDTELSLLARRSRWMWVTLAREAEEGLEAAAYGLLAALYDADDDLRGGDLADKFGLDKSTVSRQIAQMESLGLLKRVPDPQDGRARLLRITDDGRSRVRRLRERRARWLERALRDWPGDDVQELVGLLQRLNSSLESPDR
ncbi:MarR family winged helix-turn-helix transcriptional regulator [Phytoactinopolyspora halotolerans]|uniref:Winged helix-turn-helix transcriptional regulator n=1 Tax=Phytoactinopolyspora halotolerans TaxID=1981512 RepID=A0A6L9S3M1_9ACTN|nr:MarR family winged helix-turn-helix transcriptional regulator [Phytoactinopolyspora halotolerans]NEE00035.1 winged helix-turn-helix transcriptional regulator [Phytoactinopolyspora halotolerans]